ncbi:hypothetical protein BDN67DRAFT_1072530 [Paxillus ammoniavirescens]|nr:hypothetical protein BDN67DRAFT_1072530 [Paxillus ammoniavirescens]
MRHGVYATRSIGPRSYLASQKFLDALIAMNHIHQDVLDPGHTRLPTIRIVKHGTFIEYRLGWGKKLNVGPGQIKVPVILSATASQDWIEERTPTTGATTQERPPPTNERPLHPHTDATNRYERTSRMRRTSERRMHTTDESGSQGETVGSRARSGSGLRSIRLRDPLARPEETGRVQVSPKGRNGQNACRTTKGRTLIPCGRVQVVTTGETERLTTPHRHKNRADSCVSSEPFLQIEHPSTLVRSFDKGRLTQTA